MSRHWGDREFDYQMWPVRERPDGLIEIDEFGYDPVLLFDPKTGELYRQTTNTEEEPGLYKIISGVPTNVADRLNEIMDNQNENSNN